MREFPPQSAITFFQRSEKTIGLLTAEKPDLSANAEILAQASHLGGSINLFA
jgi:hypothetical protein